MRMLVLAAIVAALLLVPAAQAAPPPHLLVDLAGNGSAGFAGDGGPASLAQFSSPSDVAIAPDGRVAVADTRNHVIRVVGRDGFIFTAAGTGTAGFSGEDAAATAAQLNSPYGVAATPDGGWLIADSGNHRVRKVSAVFPFAIDTVAGDGTPGFGGDGGSATAAQLDFPTAVAPTPDGGFLVTDAGNQRVRKVSRDGTITTVAGNGQRNYSGDGIPAIAAGLDPAGVAAQPDGGFLIADDFNSRVRRVGPNGMISTIAGTGTAGSSGDGGPATGAQLNAPESVALAPDGSVLVADFRAHRVRWIDPAGTIRTLAGTGTVGYNGHARAATTIELTQPFGVAVGPSGDVVVVERAGHRLRLILAGLIPAQTAPQPPQPPTPPSTGTPRPQRLVAALGQRSLRAGRRARVRLAYVLTDDARVTVELSRPGRRVALVRQSGRVGRNQIILRRPRRPGRYRLLLKATTTDGRVSLDRGRLIVGQ